MVLTIDDLERTYRDADRSYLGEIIHTHITEGKDATNIPASEVLPAALAENLGFDPYSHQSEALDALSAGENVEIATPTSSGKTLVYALHAARNIQKNSDSTALFVYPTKALSENQQKNIGELLVDDLGLDVRIGKYDGDTDAELKRELRRDANIIITNFAGLNQYLDSHELWAEFFSNLDLIAIDESHSYTGIHGMHVAWIIRRLQRLLKGYGAEPRYVLSSATIGNPYEHARALIGQDITLVDEDGSAQGRREIAFWNPPKKSPEDREEGEISQVPADMAAAELTAHLALRGHQTLMFTSSRTMTEVGNKRVSRHGGAKISSLPYHAGLGKTSRRRAEKKLNDGDIDAAVSTNALELGIDIGGLDATVLSGYPGTRQSFWQQLGRSGRGASDALSVFVADYKSLDQYILRHPEYLLEDSVENAVIDLENNQVYAWHVLCAASEAPLTDEDAEYFGGKDRLEKAVDMWEKMGWLAGQLDSGVHLDKPVRPQDKIDLYTTSAAESFEVRVTKGDIDHEPIDRARAYRDYHEGAVVIHNGQDYVVEEFNENTAKPYVQLSPQSNLTYYTRSLHSTSINDLEAEETVEYDDFTLYKGWGAVTTHYAKYEERNMRSGARNLTKPTGLDPLNMTTQLLWVEPHAALVDRVIDEFREEDTEGNHEKASEEEAVGSEWVDIVLGALHAIEHAMIGVAPLRLMMDKQNLGGLSVVNTLDPEQNPAFYIYDGVDGGVGFSYSIHDRFAEVLQMTLELIEECECESVTGCPACTMDENCGDNNDPLHNPAAVALLEEMLEAVESGPINGASDG